MSEAAQKIPKFSQTQIILAFWALISAIFIIRAFSTAAIIPLVGDSDDAMRLVVVQDFLAGQGWFDKIQYRLNTPYGAPIHWSRLVDLPIAGLILIFQPFFGEFAVTLAAWIWPLILLLALLYLSVKITVYLVGPAGLLPGLVLPILSAAILVEFAPGRVDHHSVQIIFVMALIYASMRAWTNKNWAILAGGIAATSLAIGMETLPQIVVVVSVFGLFYVFDPQKGVTARLFGLAFAGFTLLNLALSLPFDQWGEAACDAISIVHIGAAIGVALVFLICTRLPLKTWYFRMLVSGILGIAMVGTLLVIFPQCAGGPYGEIDPWLAQNWLSQVIEAKPLWYSLEALPAYTIGIIIPPLAALIILGFYILRSKTEKKAEWLVLGLFLVAGILVVAAQIRGARLVAGMVAPVAAWTILIAREKYLNSRSLLSIFGLVGSWLIFAGLAIAMLAGFLLPKGSDEAPIATANTIASNRSLTRNDCLQPDAFVDLASLPASRIMAPIDLGAHLLLFTPHSVVGAPYHRNESGIIDSFDFFNMPINDARAILVDREISLVVICKFLPEMKGLADADEDSFVRLGPNEELPDWLRDISLPGSIFDIYEVQAPAEAL